jgi:hypothetical protein
MGISAVIYTDYLRSISLATSLSPLCHWQKYSQSSVRTYRVITVINCATIYEYKVFNVGFDVIKATPLCSISILHSILSFRNGDMALLKCCAVHN